MYIKDLDRFRTATKQLRLIRIQIDEVANDIDRLIDEELERDRE